MQSDDVVTSQQSQRQRTFGRRWGREIQQKERVDGDMQEVGLRKGMRVEEGGGECLVAGKRWIV